MGHPNKSLIVKWMHEGKGVRWICKTLREMYPDDKDKCLSVPTLQDFRKQHMKLGGDVLNDLKRVSREKENEKALSKEHTQVRNLPTYKQKLMEVVDLHVDIKRGLVGMEKLITARLEELFDMAQRGEITVDREKILQGYFDRYFMMIDKWAKYIDKVADFKVEANINVTVIQDQMAVLRQAIHELLQEMDPELAIGFLDRLSSRIGSLTYSPPNAPSAQSLAVMRNEVAMLPEAEIVGESEGNDAD